MQQRTVTIIKKDIDQVERWRYSGTIIHQDAEKITLEAFFNHPDVNFHGMALCEGDRFIETFFLNRWYNIFAIYDHLTGTFKGWYCNLSFPTSFDNEVVTYIDLALDLLIFPDGHQIELDSDEYEILPLTTEDRQAADQAFRELKKLDFKLFTVDLQ